MSANKDSLSVLDETKRRGVENPNVIDLVRCCEGSIVELVMVETRPWETLPDSFDELAEKFNNYLDYVLDGFLVAHYPQYAEFPVRIVVEYQFDPDERGLQKFSQMEAYCQSCTLDFKARALSHL